MKSGQPTGCIMSILIILFVVFAIVSPIRIPLFLWIIIVLFLWQFLALSFYGNDNSGDDGDSFLEIRRHNREIEKQWIKDGRPIVETTVGWRRDPWNKEDGYRKDAPDGREYFGDGNTYSRLIRGGTKEYREKFAKDVEESKK